MTPLVSVGLPVFNGARYVRQAVESILSQTHRDFELIVSDNGSTDDTEQICREYAARDRRVQYYRSRANRGASWNFRHVVALARGKYFKWMSHDDVCRDKFLERCVPVLDGDTSVVLCYPRTADIDEHGNFRKEKNFDLNVSDRRADVRFRSLICVNHSCFAVFGLVRLNALRRTPVMADYVPADRALLAELGLLGRFHEVPEVLFLHREHPLRSTRAVPQLQARIAWFDPAKAGRTTFPNWRLLVEYARCIGRAGLPIVERARCYAQLLPWLKFNARLLYEDLLYPIRRRAERNRAAGRCGAVHRST
ncbi:MAG TPA: glycosyltransferase family 2 protein [Phycisphaerae bacterium]|nr:glycosyltransferase family 2 protein [Phycisphaerae bacterium]